jgi:hypothetical protein
MFDEYSAKGGTKGMFMMKKIFRRVLLNRSYLKGALSKRAIVTEALMVSLTGAAYLTHLVAKRKQRRYTHVNLKDLR